MSSCRYYGNLEGQGALVGVIGDGGETPLSVVRLCGMGVPLSGTLDMSGSLQLTIQRCKHGIFEVIVPWLIG